MPSRTRYPGKYLPLRVQNGMFASHCRLTDPASRQLAKRLEGMEVRGPQFPILGNVATLPLAYTASVRQALLRQTSGPLFPEDSVRFMARAGVESYVEVGPGKVLAGLARRILPAAAVFGVQDRDSLEKTLKEIYA